MRRVVLLVVLGLTSFGCGPPVRPDAGLPDASTRDAGAQFDAGAPDAGAPDAGQPDAGPEDAGPEDAGAEDAGAEDAGLDAGTPDGGMPSFCPVPSGVGPAFRLRVLAANLTTGPNQSYTPGHGIRIMQGLDPDVVMIQEFNYLSSSQTDITSMVATTFDGTFSYIRGAGIGGGAIPNGVISRWPILDQGEWTDTLVSNRNFVWAQIDIPGPNELWVISVHLLTSSAGARNNEATALINLIEANIPSHDYVLLGGDFNTDTRDPLVEPCLTTFSQRFVTTGPHPADQLGNEGTSGNRNKPYDQVLASACLNRLQGPTVLGTSTYDAGAVIDTRVYTPLSDIAPALIGDCETAAPIFTQHMAVVKDFFIQP